MRKIKWCLEVNDELIDNNRDITIIEREIRKVERKDSKTGKIYLANEKWYKYHCNKCGNEDWNTEGAIKPKSIKGLSTGCNVCCHNPQKIVLGINTIWDKARWMCDLGISEEDAKNNFPQSADKIEVICPLCGNKKKCRIRTVYNDKTIGCICNDKQSYPEKFMYSILKQLNIEFETQYSPKWINGKRYDFYIPKFNAIIEVHGEQHYRHTGRGRSLQEEQENDKLKEEIALDNGINYIVIDCRESTLNWIKDNILKSKLNNLFDLENIDWIKCEKFAISNNLIKIACEYKKDNPNMTYTEIGKIMGYERHAIKRWIEKGKKLNWI